MRGRGHSHDIKMCKNVKVSAANAEKHFKEVQHRNLQDEYNFAFNELEKCTDRVLTLRSSIENLSETLVEATKEFDRLKT